MVHNFQLAFEQQNGDKQQSSEEMMTHLSHVQTCSLWGLVIKIRGKVRPLALETCRFHLSFLEIIKWGIYIELF